MPDRTWRWPDFLSNLRDWRQHIYRVRDKRQDANPLLQGHTGIPSLAKFIEARHDWERTHRDFHIVGMQRAKDNVQHEGLDFGTQDQAVDHAARRRVGDMRLPPVLLNDNWKTRLKE